LYQGDHQDHRTIGLVVYGQWYGDQTPGWRAVFNDTDEEKKDEENATLPKVQQGETLPITEKALLEKQTKPKPLYNEASLLKALETAGKEIDDEELRYAMKDSGLGTPPPARLSLKR
jgi:DNA topoisomerase-3